MMWIVKIALRAPYTFTVLAVLLLIGGALSTLQMAKDIFPAINIPVVGIIWTYANPDGRLFDGMYAQAKFALKNPTPWYRIIPWRIGKRRVPHRTKDTSSLKPPVKIDVCLMACENRAIIGYEAPYENSSSSPDVCTESDPQRSQSENSTGGNYET
jgi:hypothetical protein